MVYVTGKNDYISFAKPAFSEFDYCCRRPFLQDHLRRDSSFCVELSTLLTVAQIYLDYRPSLDHQLRLTPLLVQARQYLCCPLP